MFFFLNKILKSVGHNLLSLQLYYPDRVFVCFLMHVFLSYVLSMMCEAVLFLLVFAELGQT